VAWILYNHRRGTRPFAYAEPVEPPGPPPDPFADDDEFDDDELDHDEMEDDDLLEEEKGAARPAP